jgi:parallel beta-helix repeat protein
VQVVGNSVHDNSEDGIEVHWSCQTLIDSNTVRGNGRVGIDIYNANSNLVSGNTVDVPASTTFGGIVVIAVGGHGGSNDCGSWDDARDNTVVGNDVTMGSVDNNGSYGNINGTVSLHGGGIVNDYFDSNHYHVPKGDCTVNNWHWWDGAVEQRTMFPDWRGIFLQDLRPEGSCGA